VDKIVAIVNIPDNGIVIFPRLAAQGKVLAEGALRFRRTVRTRAEQVVKALIIYRDVVNHHQLAGVKVVGKTVQMVIDGDAVTYLVGDRLPFPTELKPVTGIIAGNRVLDHHNAVCTVLNFIKQVETVVDIIVRVTALQPVTLSYAHFHREAVGVNFARILVTKGFRIHYPVKAGPQRASNIRRRGNLNAGIIVTIRGDVLDQVMAALYAQALARNLNPIDMPVAGIQQQPVNHRFSVGF